MKSPKQSLGNVDIKAAEMNRAHTTRCASYGEKTDNGSLCHTCIERDAARGPKWEIKGGDLLERSC